MNANITSILVRTFYTSPLLIVNINCSVFADQNIHISERFTLKFTFVNLSPTMVGAAVQARGELLTRRKSFFLDEWLVQKRALITQISGALTNFSDNWDCCVPLAIVFGLKRIELGTVAFKAYRKQSKQVKTDVIELMRQAGLILGDPIDITSALPKFGQSKMLNNTCINVFSVSHAMERVGHVNIEAGPAINLLVYKDHCFCITNVVAMLGKNYCKLCNQRFARGRTLSVHRCSGAVCRLCKVVGCPGGQKEFPIPIRCELCQFGYFSHTCIEHHVKLGYCIEKQLCINCGRLVPTGDMEPPKAHHCMQGYCVVCKNYMDVGHLCFVRREDATDERLRTCKYDKIIYWDSETCYYAGLRKRLRALCVYLTFDEASMGKDEMFWMDKDPNGLCAAQKLLQYLMVLAGRKLLLAHNFKKFDGYMVLYAAIQLNLVPTFVSIGQSILSLRFPQAKLVFNCSLSFITSPLRKFPQLFNLPSSQLDKSHAPFLYFNPTLLDVSLAGMPAKELFEISVMSPKEKKEFNVWYDDMSMGK